MASVASSSIGYESLKGEEAFAESILEYAKGKAPHRWEDVRQQLWEEMDEEDRAQAGDLLAALGSWIGVQDPSSPVAFEDWVRVFSAVVDAGVFDLAKLPTLQGERDASEYVWPNIDPNRD